MIINIYKDFTTLEEKFNLGDAKKVEIPLPLDALLERINLNAQYHVLIKNCQSFPKQIFQLLGLTLLDPDDADYDSDDANTDHDVAETLDCCKQKSGCLSSACARVGSCYIPIGTSLDGAQSTSTSQDAADRELENANREISLSANAQTEVPPSPLPQNTPGGELQVLDTSV